MSQKLHLPALQDLTLTFCDRTLQPDILRNCVASYINDIGPQLVSFSVQSSDGSLRSLFANIGPFSPKLKRLDISAPFDEPVHAKDSALGKLIQARSGSLSELALRLTRQMRVASAPQIDIPLSTWMASVFVENEQMTLPLTILTIYPSQLAGGWEALLALCRRSTSTLERLDIPIVCPNILEIGCLLDVLSRCNRLRLLRVRAQKSDVLLAMKQVPHLLSLEGIDGSQCVTRNRALSSYWSFY